MRLVLCLLVLIGSHKAEARRHGIYETKFFPARTDSVLTENVAADALGAPRLKTMGELREAVRRGDLVPLDGLTVDRHLPRDRRYARIESVMFLRRLDGEFSETFGRHLVVDSAVRPADVQRKVARHNRCAAPAYGPRASSHERGTTVDISRRMNRQQRAWVVLRLKYYSALNKVLVIEEKACYHIFVGGE